MRANERRVVLLGCFGVALLVAVAARSAARPTVAALSFGTAIPVGYPASAFGSGDAEGIAIGNLNADGRPDLAIASYADSTVSVVLNRGRGRFRAVADYDTAAGPGETAIADVNGDGKNDLVVASGNSVSVLLNRGDGTFPAHVDYPVGHPSDRLPVALADLNGDGRLDIVAGSDSVNSMSVLLNDGDGTFAPAVPYSTVSPPYDVEAGDLNGDGTPDIVISDTQLDGVSVFTGNGDGSLGTPKDYPVGGRPFLAALADFNGDGRLDVATANCCGLNGISILLNSGGGTLSPAHRYTARVQASGSFQGVDMNGDGRPDLVYGDIRLNRGGGRFEPALSNMGFGVRNLNGDGAPDVVGQIGDLNGDGHADAAFSTLDERNSDWEVWVRLDNPGVCDVQYDRGKTLRIAARTLALANCRVGRLTYAYSRKVKKGRVLSQSPGGGAVRARGTKVNLVVSRGRG